MPGRDRGNRLVRLQGWAGMTEPPCPGHFWPVLIALMGLAGIVLLAGCASPVATPCDGVPLVVWTGTASNGAVVSLHKYPQGCCAYHEGRTHGR